MATATYATAKAHGSRIIVPRVQMNSPYCKLFCKFTAIVQAQTFSYLARKTSEKTTHGLKVKIWLSDMEIFYFSALNQRTYP